MVSAVDVPAELADVVSAVAVDVLADTNVLADAVSAVAVAVLADAVSAVAVDVLVDTEVLADAVSAVDMLAGVDDCFGCACKWG